uniref:SFRICE_035512 n=1 Tax=Spodoptera frugiperda TaxID=7108 RepID=A0A2H1WX10_SPOFR
MKYKISTALAKSIEHLTNFAQSRSLPSLVLTTSSDPNPDTLKFGLSTLHARIRFFKSLLHLSYKIPIRKWQARTQEHKNIVADRKKKIQEAFKEEMGLLVDIPKAGFGNTNDGNTSRRFFSNPEISSRITGVDINLIKKCSVLLETLSNGATVIDHAILPIGQLSEEAAEARNKHFRIYRQNFSRKCSREDCNKDVLNRLLLTSDPFLSSNRQRQRKNRKPFSVEALGLLVPETSHVSSTDFEEDDGSSEHESDQLEWPHINSIWKNSKAVITSRHRNSVEPSSKDDKILKRM